MSYRDRIKDGEEQVRRTILQEYLAQCTPKQVANFHKYFPEPLSMEKLETAIGVADRTVKSNQRKN